MTRLWGRIFLTTAVIEPQSPADDVFGHLGKWTVVADREGPQSNEGLSEIDIELCGDHAGGLVHHVPEVGTRLQLRGDLSLGSVCLQHEDGMGCYVGRDECISVLIVAKGSRPVTIEIERSDTNRSYLQGEAEDRTSPRLYGRRGEGDPPRRARMDEIGLEHGSLLLESIDTRSFAQVVLQPLDERADGISGAERALGRVARHDHDPCATHSGDLCTEVAEPLHLSPWSATA